MTDQAPDNLRSALQSLMVGVLHNAGSTTPSSTVREATTEALDGIWPQVREHFATHLVDQCPIRDARFTAGVDWAADTIHND